jgi:DNA-binding Lrp family transcriptional regulator
LRVVTPSVAAYDDFLENVIFSAAGVSQVHSNFALRQIKFETALPIQVD